MMNESEVAPMETSDVARDDVSQVTDNTDLLGFATPSEGQTMASSGDLLGFSTPPEADAATIEDLLDFASPPPPMEENPMASCAKSTEVPTVGQGNARDGDLLGFASPEKVSTEAESSSVAALEPPTGQDKAGLEDLLGFESSVKAGKSSVKAGNPSEAVADSEDVMDFASPEKSSGPGQVHSPTEVPAEQAPSTQKEGSRIEELLPVDRLSPTPVKDEPIIDYTVAAVTTEAAPSAQPHIESGKPGNLFDMLSSKQPTVGQDLPDNTGSSLAEVIPAFEEPLAPRVVPVEKGVGASVMSLDVIPPKGHSTKMESTETQSSVLSTLKEDDFDPPQKTNGSAAEVIEANGAVSAESDNAEAAIESECAEISDISLIETQPDPIPAWLAPPVVSKAESEQLNEANIVTKEVVDPWADVSVSNGLLQETAMQSETESPHKATEFSSTMVDVPLSEFEQSDVVVPSEDSAAKDQLLVELQSSLQDHMTRQAEAENRARLAEERVKLLQQELRSKQNVEEELSVLRVSIKTVVSDKAHLELQLAKLRQTRDEYERKEVVLSNRLNTAKKKEAEKANIAEQLEDEVKALRAELATTKEKLKEMKAAKEKSEQELREAKQELTKRMQQAETALADERRLNEDRKRKMKVFIETKQEEVRLGKVQTDELNAELEQTNRLLREQNSRWKQLHAQWVQSQTRNRELQRDLNRFKKDSDNMHKFGDKMEMKLSRSAQETEEHKNKRLTAKHELMTVLRTLEGEREVCSKLRDSLKFTFTPKALSQQQLLKESLQELESELQNLSRRLGRPYMPPTDSPNLFSTDDASGGQTAGVSSIDANEESDDKESVLRYRSVIESDHLISNLENETQRVSQCIMALTSSIERMHVLLEGSGNQTCFTAFSRLLVGSNGSANNGSLTQDEGASMTGGSMPVLRTRSTRYGQLPTTTM